MNDLNGLPCCALWLVKKSCASSSTNHMQTKGGLIACTRFPLLKGVRCVYVGFLLATSFPLFQFVRFLKVLFYVTQSIRSDLCCFTLLILMIHMRGRIIFPLRLSLTVSWNRQIREGSFDLRIYEHLEREFFRDLVPQNCSFRLSLAHRSY